MKKILYIALFVLALIELNAHGACLINQLKMQKNCTGGAAPIPEIDKSQIKPEDTVDRQKLEKSYQIPTISTPRQFNNSFPMINPAMNCMYGICIPK